MVPIKTVFTALDRVAMNGDDEIPLVDGLSLVRPNNRLTSGSWSHTINQMDEIEIKAASRFLVCRYEEPDDKDSWNAVQKQAYDLLRSGLMAFQVIKPIRTFGYMHNGSSGDCFGFDSNQYVPTHIYYRPQMRPGRWARVNEFDDAMLAQMPVMITRVRAALAGSDVPRANALTFLQLGLESEQPYIAGLLWVTGLEAIFDSRRKDEFKKKLCDCLGPRTLAFPNWHSKPDAPPYTVEEIAIPLFVLRNKIAHGADLRTAATDAKHPVDLLARVNLTPGSTATTQALLLSEAACYLLCQVLQKAL
jgi:hypothetical protein